MIYLFRKNIGEDCCTKMEIKIFDVVELTDKNKATILRVEDDKYYVESVNRDGMSLCFKYVTLKDINKIIYSK